MDRDPGSEEHSNREPVGVYRISPGGELQLFNRAFAELLAAPDRERLAGLATSTLYVDSEDRRAWKTMMQYEGRVESFETRIRRSAANRLPGGAADAEPR